MGFKKNYELLWTSVSILTTIYELSDALLCTFVNHCELKDELWFASTITKTSGMCGLNHKIYNNFLNKCANNLHYTNNPKLCCVLAWTVVNFRLLRLFSTITKIDRMCIISIWNYAIETEVSKLIYSICSRKLLISIWNRDF